MKKIIKFSKPYRDIFDLKKDYIDENLINLNISNRINKKYSNQPLRKKCKNCGFKLSKTYFKQFKIEYSLCDKCGHLNGNKQDTKKFTDWLYSEKKSDNYESQKFYLDKDFDDKVKKIYLPKVNFLKKVLKNKINVLEIGSGGGHFLKALEIKGISGIGYEVSKYLSKLGNKNLKKNQLIQESMDNTYKKVLLNKGANVLALIGVLEHLNKPNYIIELFKKSKIKYLYMSVPLFSLSTLIENSFKKVYPRQLSSGHTHLYTKKSLDFLSKKNNFSIVGEWWFGSDFADLYRSLIVSSSNRNQKKYSQSFNYLLLNYLDSLQSVLDKNKVCSEVHMVFKKNR